ncbi:hypothetical protein BGZ98_006439, partial [Dissophora globulifera]
VVCTASPSDEAKEIDEPEGVDAPEGVDEPEDDADDTLGEIDMDARPGCSVPETGVAGTGEGGADIGGGGAGIGGGGAGAASRMRLSLLFSAKKSLTW